MVDGCFTVMLAFSPVSLFNCVLPLISHGAKGWSKIVAFPCYSHVFVTVIYLDTCSYAHVRTLPIQGLDTGLYFSYICGYWF